MNKTGAAFQLRPQQVSRLSDVKIKKGICVGSQIKNLFKEANFDVG